MPALEKSTSLKTLRFHNFPAISALRTACQNKSIEVIHVNEIRDRCWHAKDLDNDPALFQKVKFREPTLYVGQLFAVASLT